MARQEVNRNLSTKVTATETPIFVEEGASEYLARINFNERIKSFVTGVEPFLYVEGIPIKKTPEGDIHEPAANTLLIELGSQLGEIFIPPGHRDGSLVFDIYPKEEDANEQLGTGTALDWHTDDAHDPKPCTYICLFCMRGDPNAHTFVSQTADEIAQEIPIDLKPVLLEHPVRINPDKSYSNTPSINGPALSLNDTGHFELRYDPAFTEFASESDRQAFAFLEEQFSRSNTSTTLKAGDLLIINNRIAAHARSNFRPTYDRSKDRWVKRVIVK